MKGEYFSYFQARQASHSNVCCVQAKVRQKEAELASAKGSFEKDKAVGLLECWKLLKCYSQNCLEKRPHEANGTGGSGCAVHAKITGD